MAEPRCSPAPAPGARWWARAGAAGLGVALGGCLGPVAYPCDADAQCRLGAQQGVCEPEGYCSLPDDDCPSQRRFSEHAPAALASLCVGGDASTGDASTGDTTGDPEPACEGEACGCAARLELAQDRSCAVTLDGQLWCWGANTMGELGDPGATTPAPTPQRVPLEAPVLDVALGQHACALTSDGVWCWGSDQQGQVSATNGQSGVLPPTRPNDVRLPGAVAVAVGQGWSCALLASEDEVLCWGALEPWLGVAGTTASLELGGRALGLAMTQRSLCASMASGAVLCAGSNDRGELGRDPSSGPHGVPDLVPTLAGALDLAASLDLYCVRTEQDVRCWGANQAGEAGTLPVTEATPPTTVDLVAEALGLGTSTSCAVTSAGALWCWGAALPGLGDEPDSPTPAAQDWLQGVVDGPVRGVGLGASHACVLTENAQIWCWGANESGQLGTAEAGEAQPARVALPCAD